MKQIVLLCAAGMSTSILITKMKEVAKIDGFDCEINAYSISEAINVRDYADAILLGPQVRFNIKKVKEICPNCVVESIDPMSYGMMDGKKVLDQAKRMMNYNEN